MTGERRSWADIKRARMESPAAHAGYDRARRAHELGQQVHRLRREHGLTQTTLAARAGTPQAAIARIEAGGVLPTIDSLERIGAALGVALTIHFEEASAT